MKQIKSIFLSILLIATIGIILIIGFFIENSLEDSSYKLLRNSLIIGIPVAFALGIGAVSAFYFEGLPLIIAFQRIISGINVFSLLAIPFFIFAGELMFHGGIAVRLVRLASSAVGAIRGGLGVVNVFASMLFGGISGLSLIHI